MQPGQRQTARMWARMPGRIVIADAGYGETPEFREALEERSLRYAIGIAPQVGVCTKAPKINVPAYRGRGTLPTNGDYGGQRPSSVKEVALKAKAKAMLNNNLYKSSNVGYVLCSGAPYLTCFSGEDLDEGFRNPE